MNIYCELFDFALAASQARTGRDRRARRLPSKRHVDIAMDLGLTLPGMMEEPGCNAGRLISKSPARGPDVRRIRSLEIFESFMARLFNAAE